MRGWPIAVMGFTVARGKIAEISVLAGPERFGRLDLRAVLDELTLGTLPPGGKDS